MNRTSLRTRLGVALGAAGLAVPLAVAAGGTAEAAPAKAAAKAPAKVSCPTDKGRIACVDLTRQVSWIQDGKKIKYGPVHIRSGRKGFATRTGLKKVYWRDKNHRSSLYDVSMPYSQFFDGGQAFHAISGSVYSPPGSHGCVNMRMKDAQAYWNLLHKGDDVFVYGRKPGT
ncbi:L,D-transpeptidase [Streptomyces sp. SCA2-4]|nr:L,D-transpeptidase [Streptomyces huiliensis]MBZ4318346.1 L,D-transpeptidase [Streptomyces huiliensis]